MKINPHRRPFIHLAVACSIAFAAAHAMPVLHARPASTDTIERSDGLPKRVAQDPAQGTRFGLPSPRPRTPGAIRIAAYNVENLFDHADDPLVEGRFDDADKGISDARARAIAQVIRAIDADIFALAEIESLDALRWFRDTYLDDMGYDHLASKDVAYYRGIEQSVMSRFPILEAEVRPGMRIDNVERNGPGWSELPRNVDPDELTVQRSPLRVRIQVRPNYELTMFVMHHKAGGDYDWKREAEALRNVSWIKSVWEEDRSKNIVLMGDFNTAPWYKTLRVYLQAGFFDVMAYRSVSNEEGNLYKTHRSDRVIDYILMNPAALNELIIGSPHIVSTYNPPDSWNWREDPYPDGYASDHFPLVIDMLPRDEK